MVKIFISKFQKSLQLKIYIFVFKPFGNIIQIRKDQNPTVFFVIKKLDGPGQF